MSTVLYPIKDFLKEYESFEKIKKENETLFEYAPIIAEHMENWATPENISEYFKIRTPITAIEAEERMKYVGKVIIVYGTQNPDKSGTEYDKETAYMLKEIYERGFRTYYGTSPTTVVKADTNLTSEDFKENLILVGGPVANKITMKLNSQLPITFVYTENGWNLKRNPNYVKNFNAFLITNESIMELSLDSTIPPDVYGVVETIRNPWNGNAYITIIAGVDRYGTRRMINGIGLESYVIKGEKYWEIGFYTQNGSC